MALRDVLWLENAGAVYNAGDYRRLLEGLFPRAGVIGGSDLVVAQASPTGVKVLVAAGLFVVDGTESGTQGLYFGANDAAEELTLAAADPTNARIDLVGIRIRDDEYSGASHVGDIFAVTGTPAASPVAPTAPDNFLELARVAVAANATNIVNANITDTRVRTAAGNRLIVTSTTRPTGVQGLEVYETDTGKTLVYSGSAWVELSDDGAWTTFTPVWFQNGALAGTVHTARYKREGRKVTMVVDLVTTAGSPAAGNAVYFQIPSDIAAAHTAARILGCGSAYGQLSGVQYALVAVIVGSGSPGGTVVRFLRTDTTVSNYWGIDPAVVVASGDSIGFTVTFEAAA
jgi:hypothetical protein